MMMRIPRMKTLAVAALVYVVTFVALPGNPGAQAESTSCNDAPGMEGCNDKSTSSSSSSSSDKDGYPIPKSMKLIKSVVYDEPTFVDVYDEFLLESDDVIDTTNLHFTVHEGATLTYRAPAVKIARDEESPWPLFELSGKVVFEATGSTPVLLDGSLRDESDIVEVTGDGAVFMPDPDNVVRYHRSGMTVSRMGDAADLDGPRREEVDLNPELKASLAAIHAKGAAESDVPSSTFSSSYSSTSSSSSSSSSSTSSPSSSPTSKVVDNDDEGDVCLVTPYYDTLEGPSSCPNPAFTRANIDIAATTLSANDEKDGIHATASDDCTTNDHGTSTNADCNGDTSSNTSTSPTGDSNNRSEGTGHERKHDDDDDHDHDHDDDDDEHDDTSSGSHTGAKPEQTESIPKRVLKVGETLTGSLTSATGESAIWTAEHGSITFGKIPADSSNEPGVEKFAGGRPSILVASESGPLERVIQARAALRKEQLEGEAVADESRCKAWGWGWMPCRNQLHDDVERARGHVGEVEMTITDRAGVEVTMDGTRVVSRSGRFTREWMNRFPWRRSKSDEYELHVQDEGMEVRLGEKKIWGIDAEDTTG